MDNETKILNLLKNKNYITTKEVESIGVSRKFLSLLVSKGKIARLSRAVYSLPNELEDEFLIINSKSKYAIFSNLTALFFHGLCDRMPIEYDVTVKSGYNGSLQKNKQVNLYNVKKEIHELGLMTTSTNYGNVVRVYDIERSICDIIKNKNKLDLELFNKAIRNYYYSKNKDTSKLYDYAKKLNIYEKVRKTFEVLT